MVMVWCKLKGFLFDLFNVFMEILELGVNWSEILCFGIFLLLRDIYFIFLMVVFFNLFFREKDKFLFVFVRFVCV